MKQLYQNSVKYGLKNSIKNDPNYKIQEIFQNIQRSEYCINLYEVCCISVNF